MKPQRTLRVSRSHIKRPARYQDLAFHKADGPRQPSLSSSPWILGAPQRGLA